MATIHNLYISPFGPYTEALWNGIEDIVPGIFYHPFCTGLADGTLPTGCFKHYIGQDMLYIEKDAKAFTIIAEKSNNNRESSFFRNMAKDGLETERILHKELLPLFQVSKPGQMSKVCSEYTSFLVNSALKDDYPIAVAALLPCFWVFLETGLHIRNKSEKNNPYQKWLDTYSDAIYEYYVKQYVEIVESLMNNATKRVREKMIKAFRNSTIYENMFFSEAWDIEKINNN
jgi:thiaminase/transcriptional activator TenA